MRFTNLALSFICLAATVATADPAPQEFELKAKQTHALPGAKPSSVGITFGVIPTRPMGVSTWYNPIGNEIVQNIQPAILHPIPALRAAHVRAYDQRPDLARIGLDDVAAFPAEAQISDTTKFALVSDGDATALLTLFQITIPQDKTDQWSIKLRAESVTLVDHVPNAEADRGRAVPPREPLKLTGHLVYGVRERSADPASLMSLDLGQAGAPKQIATATLYRISSNGVVVDRLDDRTLRVTDAAGKVAGEIKLESDAAEFNVSPDGSRVAVSTDRYVPGKTDADPGHREVATIVFDTAGKVVGEVIDYDDPAFLPGGRLLVTGRASGEGLFIADLAAKKVTPIKFEHGPEGKSAPDWPRNPAVSPDGKWVAYVSYRDVHVVGIDGKGWTPVWNNPKHEPQDQPTFSPDSKYVAFISVPLNVMHGPGDLMVVDVANHLRQVVDAAKGANSDLAITWQK